MGLTEFEHYDRTQADRGESLGVWARIIGEVRSRVRDVYIAVSDDYAGFSPATIDDLVARVDAAEPA
jgi:hypothetical protein